MPSNRNLPGVKAAEPAPRGAGAAASPARPSAAAAAAAAVQPKSHGTRSQPEDKLAQDLARVKLADDEDKEEEDEADEEEEGDEEDEAADEEEDDGEKEIVLEDSTDEDELERNWKPRVDVDGYYLCEGCDASIDAHRDKIAPNKWSAQNVPLCQECDDALQESKKPKENSMDKLVRGYRSHYGI